MMCALALVSAWMAAPAKADPPYQRGFVLTGWSASSYLATRSDNALERMANDGSNQAAIFTQWFMDTPTSSQIAPDPGRTPTDASILHAMEVAHASGLSVTLKPQLGIRTGNWIGYAHPADLGSFWTDYRTMLLHYADLAQQGGADTLVVGTEMATLSSDEARWRDLIAEVRTHFSGKLTYAANYDEFERVPFWDSLDYVGIDAYFGLADEANPAPGVDALTAAWSGRGYLDRIAAVSERTNRKVLFTELGYRGTHATAAHPNIWNGTQVTDTAAQGAAYEAFYRAVSQQPWMAGFYWWEVDADEWWVQDYNPLGKDGERVMADWNARLAAPSPEPPPSSQPPDASASSEAPVDSPPIASTAPPADPPTEQPTASPAPSAVAPPATTVAPPATTAANPPARAPAIYMVLRAKRLQGAVAPYKRSCNGRIQLRVRVKRGGKWRYMRPTTALGVSADGAFARRMPAGRLRVKALYSGSCTTASSAWITASG
jgi:GTA TIM-barrel-like domain